MILAISVVFLRKQPQNPPRFSICAMKFTIVLFASLLRSAFAQLAWEATERTIPPNAELKAVAATFKFTNSGKEAIRVGEIKHSCRCVSTAMDKREYGPGESGQLVMTIDREGRTGNLAESARVKTSDGKETVLSLRIQSATFLRHKPGFLVWKRGEAGVAKDFEVEVTDDKAAVKELTVTANHPDFGISVTPLEAGKRFRIRITPKTADARAVVTFTIQADYPKEQPGRILAYGKVL